MTRNLGDLFREINDFDVKIVFLPLEQLHDIIKEGDAIVTQKYKDAKVIGVLEGQELFETLEQKWLEVRRALSGIIDTRENQLLGISNLPTNHLN